MNKLLRLLLLFITFFTLVSGEDMVNDNDDWELHRFNLYFEDDMYVQTDDEYSAGERFAFTFYVPEPEGFAYDMLFLDYGKVDSYVTVALTNQIYTPSDTNATSLIEDDRPYAGWTYIDVGVHKSSKDTLRSIYLLVGMVGPVSGSEFFQNSIHRLTDSQEAMGWDNQLNNELGINLRYVHKSRFIPNEFLGIQSAIIPFAQGELGNISIKATAGVSARIGWNIPKDYGVSSIDIGGEDGISIYDEHAKMFNSPWSFSLNFSAAGSAVVRDIFLDGNTFTDSHSVDKKPFVAYYSFGLTARYKSFAVDFIETKNTKKFKGEKQGHGVGTIVVSWLF